MVCGSYAFALFRCVPLSLVYSSDLPLHPRHPLPLLSPSLPSSPWRLFINQEGGPLYWHPFVCVCTHCFLGVDLPLPSGGSGCPVSVTTGFHGGLAGYPVESQKIRFSRLNIQNEDDFQKDGHQSRLVLTSAGINGGGPFCNDHFPMCANQCATRQTTRTIVSKQVVTSFFPLFRLQNRLKMANQRLALAGHAHRHPYPTSRWFFFGPAKPRCIWFVLTELFNIS